ncbi:hypothetical protein AC1031_006150 [Aphanomyces cochlioides]|nr:hypothetical protein AC1031_006150 [Aphanomyces cochlioides]
MSDFEETDDRSQGVAATIGAVALLGFGEACFRCRRPVPLGLACKYALFNMLPSVVWRSIDMPLLCKAAKLPLHEALEPSIMSETLRMTRYIVASYGSLNEFLQWRQKKTPEALERVLRLTTSTSDLTPLSLQKHGSHVTPIKLDTDDTLDSTQLNMQQWCLQPHDSSRNDLFLLEVDFSSVTSAPQAKQTLRAVRQLIQPYRGSKGMTRRLEALVVVLTSPSTVEDIVAGGEWDICINTASVLSVNLEDFVSSADPNAPVVIHTDSTELFNQVAQGLLQHNRIPVRYRESMPTVPSAVHVIAFSKESNAIERLHVLVDQDVPKSSICIISDVALSEPSVRVLHLAQLYDQVLQLVRGQLRSGMTADEIQDGLRRRYGPMNALTHGGFRHDKYSSV